MASSVKVYFRLMQDEDGYPPVAVETLWAKPGAIDGEYVIDNIAFFARDATQHKFDGSGRANKERP